MSTTIRNARLTKTDKGNGKTVHRVSVNLFGQKITIIETKKQKVAEQVHASTNALLNTFRKYGFDLARDQIQAHCDQYERFIQLPIPVPRHERYPIAPRESVRIEDAVVPELPGVYFLWCNGNCEYVGRSVVLSKRLTRNHEKLSAADRVSWLVLDEKEIKYAECYYIGVFRPRRNYQQAYRRTSSNQSGSSRPYWATAEWMDETEIEANFAASIDEVRIEVENRGLPCRWDGKKMFIHKLQAQQWIDDLPR